MTTHESLLLVFGSVVTLAACLATRAVIVAISRSKIHAVQIAIIQAETWEVAWNLEADIAELYSTYSDETVTWEVGGRMGQALREAQSRYEHRKQSIISDAALSLSRLESRAADLGQASIVEQFVSIYSIQFPSLALIKGRVVS